MVCNFVSTYFDSPQLDIKRWTIDPVICLRFLMLHSINWPNFIVWLSLPLEILGNMCITIVYEPNCDVIKFDINLIFPIKSFFLHDQKVKTVT